MLPLYAARIEDLGQGDFVRIDCAACHHVAVLTSEALLRAGLSAAAKVLDLKGRFRCRGCGRKERAVVFGRSGRTRRREARPPGVERNTCASCSPSRVCGGTPDSAPPRRLAERVSFGLGSMRDFATPNLLSYVLRVGMREVGADPRSRAPAD